MENIILQKTRYLRALMLTMIVGFFAFGASAQTFTVTDSPDDALTHYVGRDSLVNFDATANINGTVYLYHGAFEEQNILGTSTTGAGQTINFTWPDASPFTYNLKLVEATGSFIDPEQIPVSDISRLGADDLGYSYTFDQSGGRQLTTVAYDFTGQTVRLDVNFNATPAILDDSVFVEYSTDGSSYTRLDTLDSDGVYNIDLPAGAISASTNFRLIQDNSGSIAQGDDVWRIDNLELVFGDAISADFPNEVSLGFYSVDFLNITVNDILNDQDISIGGAGLYPRDTITLQATYDGFVAADYNYVAYMEANIGGEMVTFELDDQTIDVATAGEIDIEGSIPLGVPYNENWDFYIKAYDEAATEASIGTNYSLGGSAALTGGTTNYIMDGTNQTVESGFFLDPGAFGDYDNDENFTQTFFPSSANGKLRIDFTSFELEGCCDFLTIYDGPNTTATVIGSFNGFNNPGVIEATTTSGAITFRFTSDFSVVRPGWDATISTVVPSEATDVEVAGGEVSGSVFSFFEEGERSLTTEPLAFSSSNGVATFDLRNDNSSISPAGTEIVIEYSTDGNTYTELAEVDLNDVGTGFTTFVLDSWPAGVASATTQFRFRQRSNAGLDLNSWSITNVYFDINSNIINGRTFEYDPYGTNFVNDPIINLEVYDILANGEVFPGNQITLNYEILDGAFPAGTELDAIFDRMDALGYLYSVGSSSTLNGTIDITIPAVTNAVYDVYLETSNGVQSNVLNLNVSGITLQVDSIVGTPNVTFQGNEVYYPGSDVEVFYTLTGDPAGADLLFEVEDNISSEYVTIGTSSTFDGSISASLPDSIDYTGNYRLSVSTGQPLVAGGSSNLENDNYGGSFSDATEAELWTLEGYEFGSAFTGTGVRSATSEAFEIPNGARVQINIDEDDDFSGPFDVILQASVDGSTWVGIDTATLSFNGDSYFFNELLPTSVWSANTQFRVISNEDEAFGYNENTFDLTSFQLTIPNSQEYALATGVLNIVFPTLAVEDLEMDWTVGEDIAIDFNLTGPFPANTWLAAVIENTTTGEYEVIGEMEATEVGVINGTFPANREPSMGNIYNSIKVVPYIKETAETQYEQGENIAVDQEEDFLVIEGESSPSFQPANFNFDKAGSRSLLTRAFDLSSVSTAFIDFDFTGNFDMNGNQNLVPRLQVSIDGGSTFQEIPINEMNEEVGLIYNSGSYTIPVPEEYLTAATHFRWVQPLNLGDSKNTWIIGDGTDPMEVILGEINALQTSYIEVGTPQTINLFNPGLVGYSWTQANVQDEAVFNGESFQYIWGISDGFAEEDVDAFPAGTEFTFTLDGVTDPETGKNLVLGTVTEFGTFDSSIPLYVESNTYPVLVSAIVTIDEMEIELAAPTNVGTIDVFNQVLETTFDGNANEVYYAGNEVTVNYAFENDVTSTAFTDLQYNLILNYNGDRWLLAVDESFTGSFTVDMPPFVTGGVDFIVEASEGGPLGTVGEILDPTSIDLNDADSWINDEVALVDNNNLPGGTSAELDDVSGRRVLTTTDFDLVAENAASLSFNLTVSDGGPLTPINVNDVLADQVFIFEYSTDGGASYTEIETFFTEGDEDGLVDINIPRTYQLDGDILTASTRFRFRQEESRFTILIENMTISEAGKAQIDYVSAGTNGFAPSIRQQTIQVTSIEGDDACLSDDVTVNYEIRGKFGADNMVSVEYAFGEDLRSDEINVDVGDLDNLRGDDHATTGSYPITFDQDDAGNSRREGRTTSFDISGGDAVEVAVDITTLGTLGNNLNLYISSPGNFSFVGSINSDGVHTFMLDPNEISTSSRLYIRQFGNPATGADVWLLNGISFQIFGAQAVEGYEFAVTEGTGSLTVQLPNSLFNNGDFNKDLRFRLNADDDTFEAINQDFEVMGSFTETTLEVIAPINDVVTFSVADPLACSTEDVIATINAGEMQDYFLYEILNAADGTVLGSLVRDPEDYQNEINIGEITASTDLELRVSSQSSTGTVCNTLTKDERSVEVLANFALYSELDDDNFSQLVAAGDELTTCNGASEFTLTLERMRENADNEVASVSSDATVEWFRDNANNLVGSQYTLTDANVTESGAYFARITDGSCIYTTESIQINVIETPDQPEITVVSGDLIGCESSAEDVVLEAPEGFAYYSWSSGEATRSITVEEEGSYSVTVSNVAGGGCATATSLAVDVTRYDTPDFEVSLTTNTNGLIGANEVLDVCAASDIIYFFENDSYGNNGIVEVIKDGVSIENVTSNSYTVTESGVYSFVWNFNSLNVEGCTAESVEFTVNLNDVADVTPTIAVTGDLNSCDPENEVTLEGPEGFANYVWSRGGTALSVNARSISVSQGGSYTLQVSNVDLNDNCGLSNSSSPVVVNAAPDAEDYQLRLISYGYLTDGEEVDICSDDVNNTIEVRRGTSTNLLGATVKWFRDGAEFTPNFDNNTVVISESGVYNAEVKLGQCAVATYAVTINIVATPDAPVLASTGALSFCEGEGTVTLTAPAGFDYYTWRRGTTLMNSTTNGLANSNVIEVSTTGSYTVTVSNSATDCASDLSNPIVVNVVDEPNLPSLNQVNTTCGDGAIEFSINNNNNGGSAMTYQLYNGETGQASGNPVTIQGNQIGSIFTDVLTEDGIPFYVEAMYADGTGCSHVDPAITREANVRTITLEIEGATLTASYDGNADVRWYRNEVLLANATGNNSITIADAAEYTVEVEYANGCLLTASSADIDGRVLSNRDAMDMQVTSYPNPTQSDVTLNVSSQYMGKHEVIITSMTGQIMMQSSFEKSSFEANHAMNVANLQEGIYNVQIRHDGLTQNVRIIKK